MEHHWEKFETAGPPQVSGTPMSFGGARRVDGVRGYVTDPAARDFLLGARWALLAKQPDYPRKDCVWNVRGKDTVLETSAAREFVQENS